MHVAVTHDNSGAPAQCCYVVTADRGVIPTAVIATGQGAHMNGRGVFSAAAWMTTFITHCNKINKRLALLCRKPKPRTRAKRSAVYAMKNPYRDASTHFVFEPPHFRARLAALVQQPHAGPRSSAGHNAPRSQRPPTHGAHDLDGAPALGVWPIASQSAFRPRCELAQLISLSARIAAGSCVASPA